MTTEGYLARRMIKIHDISNENKIKRVKWANSLSRWNEEDFNRIFFSDESKMCAEKQGIKWIRKLP